MRQAPSFRAGFSLVEVMVATSILGILCFAVVKMSDSAFKAASISNSRQDLASLKMIVRDQVSCPLTLGLPSNYDFSVPVPCGGPYKLKKVSPSNAAGVLIGVSVDAERTQLGDYKIRATCVSNQLQIMVESTRKDPVTKKIPPPKDLFAGAGGNGLCSQYFTGATCPAGKVVTGVANGMPVCSAACPPGTVASFDSSGQPTCVQNGLKNFSCPDGNYVAGFDSNGGAICRNLPAGGGRYQTWHCTAGDASGVMLGDPNNGGCRNPNPKTGSCSCPPGFSPHHVNDFSMLQCPQTFYENRGMIMYECN